MNISAGMGLFPSKDEWLNVVATTDMYRSPLKMMINWLNSEETLKVRVLSFDNKVKSMRINYKI